VIKVAPTVFLIGWLLLVSFGVHEWMARTAGVYLHSSEEPHAQGSKLSNDSIPGALQWLVPVEQHYWEALDYSRDYPLAAWANRLTFWDPLPATFRLATLLGLFCALLLAVLPLRFNINEFSMHHFYKNRLVRCYLGAGRAEERRPNPFTGFDSRDDLGIATLVADPAQADEGLKPPKLAEEQKSAAETMPRKISRAVSNMVQKAQRPVKKVKAPAMPYFGPYAIVNTALNLNTGSELAQQERRASSFIFSPLYCGFDPPSSREDEGHSASLKDHGYRRTKCYMYPDDGPAIGTAMGISGAAANPNWGYHTSGPMAFLLTIFNVRLGWWLGNPRKDGPSRRPGPLNALISLLSELFAQTTGRSNYLNVSDGGHFENLGLYELVKRRCRYIIVCDGEEDAGLHFESLGGAIRKCRADFGAEIDLDPKRIRRAAGISGAHCVLGSITYPPDPRLGTMPGAQSMEGWILYLKASLTGDEPEDVTQYHDAHPAFPHEPTSNQFFTESQFESYRRLGLHVVQSAFENVTGELRELRGNKSHEAMTALFRSLRRWWYPPSSIVEGVATRHTAAYSALMKRLSDDEDLRYLDDQIIKPKDRAPRIPARAQGYDVERKAFLFCLDLIQLMENVWIDLHLYQRADAANPGNDGWMGVFGYWVTQPIFEKTWGQADYTFNRLFQQFYNELKSRQDVAVQAPALQNTLHP